MLKRTVARVMLFGIPFTLSYLVHRPAPRPAPQTFVVCAYPDENLDSPAGEIVIALNSADCERESLVLQRKSNVGSQGLVIPALQKPGAVPMTTPPGDPKSHLSF